MRIGEMTQSATLVDYLQLTKPRITFMVVLTTLAGFYIGSAGAMDVPLLLHTLIGTALVVASSNTLNQLLERDADALCQQMDHLDAYIIRTILAALQNAG